MTTPRPRCPRPRTLLGLALIAAAPVLAQPAPQMWRCGPDGRVFTDRPCADGRPVAPARRVSPQALDEARAVNARERQTLAQLTQERRQRLEQAAREGAAGIGRMRASPADGDPSTRPPRTLRPARPYTVRAPG